MSIELETLALAKKYTDEHGGGGVDTEKTTNKVAEINDDNKDSTELYPSVKAVNDFVGNKTLDTDISDVQDNDALVWSEEDGKWINKQIQGGSSSWDDIEDKPNNLVVSTNDDVISGTNSGWLENEDGSKYAPKTFVEAITNKYGVPLEDLISSEGGTIEKLYHQERTPTNSNTYTITFDKKPSSWVRISSSLQAENNHNYALFLVGQPYCNFIWSNGNSYSNRKATLTWSTDMMSLTVVGHDASGCSNAGTDATHPTIIDYYYEVSGGGGGGSAEEAIEIATEAKEIAEDAKSIADDIQSELDTGGYLKNTDEFIVKAKDNKYTSLTAGQIQIQQQTEEGVSQSTNITGQYISINTSTGSVNINSVGINVSSENELNTLDSDGLDLIKYDEDHEIVVTTSIDKNGSVSIEKGSEKSKLTNESLQFENESESTIITISDEEISMTNDSDSATFNATDGASKAVSAINDGNGNNIVNTYATKNSLSDYVQIESGKSLVSNTDITQITTNKNAITTLNGNSTTVGSVDYKVAQAIGNITQFEVSVVSQLPTTGVKGTIYFVPKTTTEDNNIYDEYIWVTNKFEKIGDTQIDLSNYYTKSEIEETYATKDELNDYLPLGDSVSVDGDYIGYRVDPEYTLGDTPDAERHNALIGAKDSNGTVFAQVGTSVRTDGQIQAHLQYKLPNGNWGKTLYIRGDATQSHAGTSTSDFTAPKFIEGSIELTNKYLTTRRITIPTNKTMTIFTPSVACYFAIRTIGAIGYETVADGMVALTSSVTRGRFNIYNGTSYTITPTIDSTGKMSGGKVPFTFKNTSTSDIYVSIEWIGGNRSPFDLDITVT